MGYPPRGEHVLAQVRAPGDGKGSGSGLDSLEGEEQGAGPHDEEQGQVEDPLLAGHHHPAVAAERVLPRQLLPFAHLPGDHDRRHAAAPLPARVQSDLCAKTQLGRILFFLSSG